MRGCAKMEPMGFLKRSESVDIVVAEKGVMVVGSESSVAKVRDLMLRVVGDEVPLRSSVASAAAGVANVVAFAQTHKEYFEFSAEAMRRLKEYGSIETKGGYFRSFVRDGRLFAGNLDWKPANFGPEQALSLQAAAAQMAIRAAIAEVQAAIDEVKDIVDDLAKWAEAERLGNVLGDRRTLEPLLTEARSGSGLSRTSWQTVAWLGPQMTRDIESLRARLMREVADQERSRAAGGRADQVDVLEDRVKMVLALLVVAEENLAWWKEIELAHARDHEPAALATKTAAAREFLDRLDADDRSLVTALQDKLMELTRPSGFEGLNPFARKLLTTEAASLSEAISEFAERRRLVAEATELVALPDARESFNNVKQVVADGLRRGKDAVASVVPNNKRAVERGEEPQALEPGGEPEPKSDHG
ncbi:MAG TPA: hypothetical protein DCR14_17950 [Acidimicrobiaceae bacterium]|nr:hypothetical protein [Acidimicrobiaceae bacterium]